MFSVQKIISALFWHPATPPSQTPIAFFFLILLTKQPCFLHSWAWQVESSTSGTLFTRHLCLRFLSFNPPRNLFPFYSSLSVSFFHLHSAHFLTFSHFHHFHLSYFWMLILILQLNSIWSPCFSLKLSSLYHALCPYRPQEVGVWCVELV